MLSNLIDLDRGLFLLINRGARWTLLDQTMPLLAGSDYLIIPAAAVALVVLIAGSSRSRWVLLALIVVFALGDSLSTYVLRPFFARPRPYTVLDQVWVYKGYHWLTSDMFPPDVTLSFPSNHAVNTVSAAAVLIAFFRRWWPLPAALAALVCFSRIYMGLHYPADILAGAVVGLGCAGLFFGVQRVLIKRYPQRFTWLTENGRN
ncbi:MAG: phosphatase PAP2 family protein [Thermodesulfobacteriota bacterium]